MKKQFRYILIPIFFWIYSVSIAQVSENLISIEIGKKSIDISEPFTISVILKQYETAPKITFPIIKGFQKQDQNISRSEIKNNSEKKAYEQTITQNYYAEKTGIIAVPSLSIDINNQSFKTDPISIDVMGEDEPTAESILNNETSDAFVGLIPDRTSVYIGEGFNIRLSFFVAESTADMEFYMVDEQLTKILKAIKPINCWEENFKIREIPHFPITIRGKKYTEYKIYQASFFPITNQEINFPSFEFIMKLNHEKAGKKTVQHKSFVSKPIKIKVKSLPKFKSNEQLAVGIYQLNEHVKQNGNFYEYWFEIEGVGTITTTTNPLQNFTQGYFDIYPPTVTQNISYINNKVYTKRALIFKLIPKQSGVVNLGELFYWPYFNPAKSTFDTLRSNIKLLVQDKNIQSSNIQTSSNDPFGVYQNLENTDTSQIPIDYQQILRNFANVILTLMLLGMIYIILKK